MHFLKKTWLYYGLLSLIIAAAAGCSSQQPASSPMKIPPELKKVLVVDFRDMTKDKSDNSNIRCPLSGKYFVGGDVAPDAEQFLTKELMGHLKDRKTYKFISSAELLSIQEDQLFDGRDESERRMLVEAGKKMGADALISGHIYRFVDRVGGNLSVDRPASVAFDLHLLRVADGRVLWSGDFDDTQKALMEDLFQFKTFFQREGRWITSKEMAEAGLEKILEKIIKP